MSIAPIRTLKNRGGGALITYYDGSTVLGERRVAKGKDVLHPAITMPSKSGKTFVGWATTNAIDDWVGTLVSTGEPMNLYAMYVDNTLTVVNAGTITQSKYASGDCSISQYITWNNNTWSASFNINKRRYGSGTIVANASFGNAGTGSLEVGRASLDGVQFISAEGGGSGSRSISASNGSHSLSLYLISYNDYAQTGTVSATVTLTNPIAWT